MEETLHGDPFTIITNSLSPIDIYNIKFTNKTFYDQITYKVLKKMH